MRDRWIVLALLLIALVLRSSGARAESEEDDVDLDVLVRALGARSGAERLEAIEALAEEDWGAQPACPALCSVAREDRSARVRYQAVRALGTIAGLRDARIWAARWASTREDWGPDSGFGPPENEISPETRRLVVSTLKQALDDPDGPTRAAAARSIAMLWPHAEACVPALRRHLQDQHRRARFDAAFTLANMAPEVDPTAAVPVLLEAFLDHSIPESDPYGDSDIAWAAGTGIPREPRGACCSEAMRALVRTGDRGLPELIRIMTATGTKELTRLLAVRTAVSLDGVDPRPLVPHLVTVLKGKQPLAAADAARALERLAEKATPALAALEDAAIEHEEAGVRQEALTAIVSVGGRSARTLTALRGALLDRDRFVRWTSIEALIAWPEGAAKLRSRLWSSLGDREPLVAATAVRALALLPTPDLETARHIQRRIPGQKDLAFRMEAVRTLIHLGGTVDSAIRALVESLEAAIPRMGPPGNLEQVSRTFLTVGDTARLLSEIGPLAAPAAPCLVRMLEVRDPHMFRRSCEALSGIGPVVHTREPTLLPRLLKAASDPDVMYRTPAIMAVAELDPKRVDWAANALVAMALEGTEEKVANLLAVRFASDGLVKLGAIARKPAKKLRPLLSHPWFIRQFVAWTWLRLGMEQRDALKMLVKDLADTEPIVRQGAAHTLGECGAAARPALEDLREALENPAGAVREAAAEAIEKIEGK